MTKQWVLIGQRSGGTDEVIGYYTDSRALFDDKIEALKEGYHKFITAQVGNPPRLAPVSDKELSDCVAAHCDVNVEETMKGTRYGN